MGFDQMTPVVIGVISYSEKSFFCPLLGAGGTANPKCSYALDVSFRPRMVRSKNPILIRNGS